MPPPATTIPNTIPWKPTRDQVRAAAMAFARVDGAEWMRLPASSREDFLIDGHAALMAAHQIAPRTIITHGDVKPGDVVVCMRKEHADAYAELFAASDAFDIAPVSSRAAATDRFTRAMARLRSLASPEQTTP